MMEYFQIEYIPDPNRMIDQQEIVNELKQGNISITSYGRNIIDLNSRTSYLINEIENKEKELNTLKENIFSQVLTIMGIFIIIITLINQGMNLLSNKDFMNKCLLQQLVIAFTVYLPLIIIIILIIFLSYIINKLFLNRPAKKK